MKKGHCLVIRYEGPKGSPGMPEQLLPGAALLGAGLGKYVRMYVCLLCRMGSSALGRQASADGVGKAAFSPIIPTPFPFHSTKRDVALVTDGRFSGASHGIMVGHVTPEAADGGALALVRDGDGVCIDLRVRVSVFMLVGGSGGQGGGPLFLSSP